jgi:hypothetical protein
MEPDPEMRFASSWGQVDALLRLRSKIYPKSSNLLFTAVESFETASVAR